VDQEKAFYSDALYEHKEILFQRKHHIAVWEEKLTKERISRYWKNSALAARF
jgi:hypothetical protein